MLSTIGEVPADSSRERMTETAVTRSWTERLIAATATAVAVFLLLYFPDRDDGSGSLLGAISTLVAVALGLAAVEKPRSLPKRSTVEHARLIGPALGLGVGLGVANLIFNYGMASLDPAIYEQMVTRWSEFSAWSVVISEPVVEEIIFRLLLMSAIGWIAARFTDNRRIIFFVALGISSLLFGIAHIFYGGVHTPLYRIGIGVKSGALALLMGWSFWRWGLPYSIVIHCTANAVHLVLWPVLF